MVRKRSGPLVICNERRLGTRCEHFHWERKRQALVVWGDCTQFGRKNATRENTKQENLEKRLQGPLTRLNVLKRIATQFEKHGLGDYWHPCWLGAAIYNFLKTKHKNVSCVEITKGSKKNYDAWHI
jgi:isochorismate synthase EntC